MTDEPTTDLATTDDVPSVELVLVSTGERLPATRENAAAVILAAREAKHRLDGYIRDAQAFLAEESRRQGTKTFHTEYGKVVLSGGETTRYDPERLAEELRKAGCPEERVNEVVHTKPIEYVVDKRILKQLTGANPKYAAAAALAATTVDEPIKADVKTPRQGGTR